MQVEDPQQQQQADLHEDQRLLAELQQDLPAVQGGDPTVSVLD